MLVAVYLAVGVVFALAFLSRGIGRVDPASHGAPLAFRALIAPGVVALWPLLARRWRKAAASPGSEGRGATAEGGA